MRTSITIMYGIQDCCGCAVDVCRLYSRYMNSTDMHLYCVVEHAPTGRIRRKAKKKALIYRNERLVAADLMAVALSPCKRRSDSLMYKRLGNLFYISRISNI